MIAVPLLADLMRRDPDLIALAGAAAFCLASWVIIGVGIWAGIAALVSMVLS